MSYLTSMVSGRLNRSNFLGASILRLAAICLLGVVVSGLGFSDENITDKIILWSILAVLWYFGYTINLRRLYDMNTNNVLSIFLSFILGFPFSFFSLLFLFLLIKGGTKGINKYGEPDNDFFLEAVFKLKELRKK